ncbi:MAG: tetratricopeptide repeat protein [Burkholderiaceae bacterium]
MLPSFLLNLITRNIRLSAYFLICALAACSTTESARPLLPANSGVAMFDDGATGVTVNRKGRIAINADRSTALVELKRIGSQYRVTQVSNSQQATVSFHPVPGSSALHLVQIQKAGKKGATYMIVRLDDATLRIDNFAIDAATLKAAQRNKLGVTRKSEYTTMIGDARSLTELVRLYTQINAQALTTEAGYDAQLTVATSAKERRSLRAAALRLSCLAHAGHPTDTAVQALPGTPGYGMQMDRINLAVGRPVCEQAAELNPADTSVRYALSRALYKQRKYNRAMALVDELKAQDYPLAYVLDAQALVTGNGRKKNIDAARKTLAQARAGGSPVAEFYEVYYQSAGVFGKPDLEVIRQKLRAQVAQHDMAHAKTALGLMLLNGQGGPTDLSGAQNLFRSASNQRDGRAAYQLAVMLYTGKGAKKDRKQAFRLASTAAKAGFSDGEYLAGFMLSRGQGITKDEKRALKLFRSADKHRHIDAGAELGRMLALGLGTKADKTKGLALLQSAADKGSANAKAYLKSVGAAGSKESTGPTISGN